MEFRKLKNHLKLHRNLQTIFHQYKLVDFFFFFRFAQKVYKYNNTKKYTKL